MNPTSGRKLNSRDVPPDPGGRSRYLIRAIVITCVVGVVLAVVMMLALREAAPPPTPQQQPAGGSTLLTLPRPSRCLAA